MNTAEVHCKNEAINPHAKTAKHGSHGEDGLLPLHSRYLWARSTVFKIIPSGRCRNQTFGKGSVIIGYKPEPIPQSLGAMHTSVAEAAVAAFGRRPQHLEACKNANLC